MRLALFLSLAIAASAQDPKVLWKKDVGAGFAGPAALNGKVILFHRVGYNERVECLDGATGRGIWMYEYPTSYRDDFGFDEGPRSTPAIADGAVYTLGAEGTLTALDFETGKLRWSVDTFKKYRVRKAFFGQAGTPLIDSGRVMLNVGGELGGIVAFDPATGKELWKATKDEASYSSGAAATIGKQRHAFFFTRAGLVDLDPADGRVIFSFPWRSRLGASVNAATPLIIGNLVFISASYGTGAALLEVNGPIFKKLWSNDDSLSNHYSTSVHLNGFLYGFHGRQEEGQAFRCIELKTGKVMWTKENYQAGTVTLSGDTLIVVREGGGLVIAAANPKEFKPGPQVAILPGIIRAYPALSGGLLYARNEHQMVCVRISQ